RRLFFVIFAPDSQQESSPLSGRKSTQATVRICGASSWIVRQVARKSAHRRGGSCKEGALAKLTRQSSLNGQASKFVVSTLNEELDEAEIREAHVEPNASCLVISVPICRTPRGFQQINILKNVVV
ncbi:hypothetical protein, partial [Bradyrhizobium sp. Mp27]|uniref:hypothetical protein n=1 Tax=Bradyrhizobium sp. Mp27 TaxID=3042157 RepID=UPI00248AC841